MKIEHNENHPLAPRLEAIMEGYDHGRLGLAGGYPSDWMILGELVVIATLGGGDWNEPCLEIYPIDEFVNEQEAHIKDFYGN